MSFAESSTVFGPNQCPAPSKHLHLYLTHSARLNTTKSFICNVSIANGEEQSHFTEEEDKELAFLPALSGPGPQTVLFPNKPQPLRKSVLALWFSALEPLYSY